MARYSRDIILILQFGNMQHQFPAGDLSLYFIHGDRFLVNQIGYFSVQYIFLCCQLVNFALQAQLFFFACQQLLFPEYVKLTG